MELLFINQNREIKPGNDEDFRTRCVIMGSGKQYARGDAI